MKGKDRDLGGLGARAASGGRSTTNAPGRPDVREKPKLFDSSIVSTAQEAVDFITNILESSTEYSVIAKDLDGKDTSLERRRATPLRLRAGRSCGQGEFLDFACTPGREGGRARADHAGGARKR